MGEAWEYCHAWQYRIEVIDNKASTAEIEIRLDQLGHFGWELVAVKGILGTSQARYVFKRAK